MEASKKTAILTMRTTPEAKAFVTLKSKALGITGNAVMKKMFTYAATNMTKEDWQ